MAEPSRPARPDPADAVHVRLGRRRHVEVDDVGQLLDVEAAGRHVGRDQQFGAAAAQASHDPVALVLAHAAVQRLGAVAAPVQGLGDLVDLFAGTAEDDRRGGASTSRIRPSAAGLCARATM